MAQWLKIPLPIQETWVRFLSWEDPTCHGAMKPVCHNYYGVWALEPVLFKKRGHHNEKPEHHNQGAAPAAVKTQCSQK